MARIRLLFTVLAVAMAAMARAEDATADIDQAWDWDHAEISEDHFTAMLEQAGDDVPLQAELLTQIARAQDMQSHYDQAQQSLDRADALQPEAGERVRVRWLLESGRLAWQQQRLAQALEHWKEAASVAQAGHWDLLAIDALHMLATYDPANGLAWTTQALALIRASSDRQAQGFCGPLYHDQAASFQDHGQFAEALLWHKQDLDWRIEHGLPASEQRVARLGMASATRGLGKAAEALDESEQLLAEAKAEPSPDPWELGTIQQEQGQCLLALGRAAEALGVLTTAQKTLTPLFDSSDATERAALAAAIARATAARHAAH